MVATGGEPLVATSVGTHRSMVAVGGLLVDKLTKSVHKWHMTSVCPRMSSSLILQREHMTLAINMLNKFYPLAHQNAKLSSHVSQCATLNIVMYANFEVKKRLVLTNNIILAISVDTTHWDL